MFGYKNHVGIDRAHGFDPHASRSPTPRPMTAASSAPARHRQHGERGLGRHRLSLGGQSRPLLARRGLVPQFQRPSRAASRCRRTSAAATPHARKVRAARRARLRRPEAAAGPGRPHGRHGPRHGQDRPRQSRLQSSPASLAGEPKRRMNATPTAPRGQGAAQQDPGDRQPSRQTPRRDTPRRPYQHTSAVSCGLFEVSNRLGGRARSDGRRVTRSFGMLHRLT